MGKGKNNPPILLKYMDKYPFGPSPNRSAQPANKTHSTNQTGIRWIASTTCSLLDHALYEFSHDFVNIRSNNPSNSRIPKFLSPVFGNSGDLGMAMREHHRAFFHEDDGELKRRARGRAKWG
jgi:hypothetical protein